MEQVPGVDGGARQVAADGVEGGLVPDAGDRVGGIGGRHAGGGRGCSDRPQVVAGVAAGTAVTTGVAAAAAW